MEYTHFLLQLGLALAYIVIFAIIFAESGLFFGFFLPGDSLLFTLGLLASQGHFSLPLLIILCCVAAISGDSVGYAFGKKVGPSLFNRPNSRFFRKEHVEKAQAFYNQHGVKTIVLARFVPVARTFAPILAGVGNMDYRTFVLYNMMGGIFWVVLLTVLGYFLGNVIPNVEKYILPAVGVIIVLSLLPAVKEILKARKQSAS